MKRQERDRLEAERAYQKGLKSFREVGRGVGLLIRVKYQLNRDPECQSCQSCQQFIEAKIKGTIKVARERKKSLRPLRERVEAVRGALEGGGR